MSFSRFLIVVSMMNEVFFGILNGLLKVMCGVFLFVRLKLMMVFR